jgi:hypothetical protein
LTAGLIAGLLLSAFAVAVAVAAIGAGAPASQPGAMVIDGKAFQVTSVTRSSGLPDLAQQGTQRVHLEAVFSTSRSAGASFAAPELAVRATDGTMYPVHVALPFGSAGSSVALGQAQDVDLFADVPQGATGLSLRWACDGQTRSIAIP